jgi:DNA-binding winged helix-turn-helix (wHTH) protein/TolB-like protein
VPIYRFGLFDFDAGSGELRKDGRPIPLEPQPARVLAALLARPGALVSHDDLRHATWEPGTFVDFERGLAYCLSQVRGALGDSARNPRFVETVPRRGYRFIAPVHSPEVPAAAGVPAASAPPDPVPAPESAVRRIRPAVWVVAVAVALAVALAAGWVARSGHEAPGPTIVAVSIFDNETGLPHLDGRVAGLSDLVVVDLAQLAPARLAVVGNAAVLRRPRNIRDLRAVAAGVRADYVVLGQLQRAESGFRFITHVIRLRDETHLRANRLTFADGDLSPLEASVLAEFRRAVHQHVLD